MTIKTSGTLQFTDIIAEFGGGAPYLFSNYYRGGPLVPAGAGVGTGSYQTSPMVPQSPAPISASGTLEMSQFYGTSATGGSGSVTINGGSVTCMQGNYPTGTTNCYVRINSDGTISHGGGGGSTTTRYFGPTTWNAVNGTGINYSGTYSFAITNINSTLGGTWTPNVTGSTGAACDVSASVGAGQACSVIFTVQILDVSSTVIATFTIDLELDNT